MNTDNRQDLDYMRRLLDLADQAERDGRREAASLYRRSGSRLESIRNSGMNDQAFVEKNNENPTSVP